MKVVTIQAFTAENDPQQALTTIDLRYNDLITMRNRIHNNK